MLVNKLINLYIVEKAFSGLVGKKLDCISGEEYSVIDIDDINNPDFPIQTIKDGELYQFSWDGKRNDGKEIITDLGISLITSYSGEIEKDSTVVGDLDFVRYDENEKLLKTLFNQSLNQYGFLGSFEKNYIFSFSDSLTEMIDSLKKDYSYNKDKGDDPKLKICSRWISRITEIGEYGRIYGDHLIMGLSEYYLVESNTLVKRTIVIYPDKKKSIFDSKEGKEGREYKASITTLSHLTSFRLANHEELDIFYKIHQWDKKFDLPRGTMLELDSEGNLVNLQNLTPSQKPLNS